MEDDFNNMLGDLSSVIKDLEFFSVVRFMISNLRVYCLKCTGLELLGWEHTLEPILELSVVCTVRLCLIWNCCDFRDAMTAFDHIMSMHSQVR